MATDGITVGIRSLAGEKKLVAGLQLDDPLTALVLKVAEMRGLLLCEVGLSKGAQPLSFDDYTRTLSELCIHDGTELNFVRRPRLTLSVLQGQWVNAKGARISVEGSIANISGLVTYPVKVDGEGTVFGVGDNLRVKDGASVTSVLRFVTDQWFRVNDEEPDFVVILRTVGGAFRQLDSLCPDDTLSVLRTSAFDALTDELPNLTVERLFFRMDQQAFVADDDPLTLRQLCIKNGSSLLCVS